MTTLVDPPERNDLRERTRRRRRRARLVLILLVAALAALIVGASFSGPVNISLRSLVKYLTSTVETGESRAAGDRAYRILVDVRLPRVLMAACVGCALAASGVAMQAVFRNPLASPYVLGVSSGAAFGASLAVVLGLKFFGFLSPTVLLAFGFALVPAGAVYLLGVRTQQLSRATLILTGVAAGAFFSALVSFMLYLADERLHTVVFWLMGGLWHADWTRLAFAAPVVAVGVAVLFRFTHEMNVLAFGDRSARDLGVAVERVKKFLLIGATLATAAAVAVTGVIGFVGLVVPHVMRMLLGANHRLLLPASCLGGALLLLAVDWLCRSIMQPMEIPVGIITALLGAPFFIILLVTKRGRRGWSE